MIKDDDDDDDHGYESHGIIGNGKYGELDCPSCNLVNTRSKLVHHRVSAVYLTLR